MFILSCQIYLYHHTHNSWQHTPLDLQVSFLSLAEVFHSPQTLLCQYWQSSFLFEVVSLLPAYKHRQLGGCGGGGPGSVDDKLLHSSKSSSSLRLFCSFFWYTSFPFIFIRVLFFFGGIVVIKQSTKHKQNYKIGWNLLASCITSSPLKIRAGTAASEDAVSHHW